MIYFKLHQFGEVVHPKRVDGCCIDPVASSRLLKIPRIIDDGIREAVATRPEHAVGDDH